MITLVRDEPGTILAGKYELLRKAGTGGMAVVWKARTLGAAGFSRPVAVKRIIPHLATSQEFVAMFVEESRVVSELQHPGIAQIHDFGADEAGHHFLVLEWIDAEERGLGTAALASGPDSAKRKEEAVALGKPAVAPLKLADD